MFKNLKKLFAIVLTSVLFLCMTLPVNAASATHKITITNAGSGHEYEVYEVFKGSVNASGHIGDAEWGTGVDKDNLIKALKESENIGNLFQSCTTASDVINIISAEENDSTILKELAQIIGENLTDAKGTMEFSDGKYEATLESGYYFIKDKNDSKLAQTRYILTLTKDQNITVKGETPTIAVGDNESSSLTGYVNDFQIGDIVKLQMIGSLPSYNSFNDYTTYKYVFHVSMPEGLTVEGNPIVELYKGTEKINDVDLSTCFTYSPTDDGFDVVCNNLKEVNNLATNLKNATGEVYSQNTSNSLQIKVNYQVKANIKVQFSNSIKSTVEYSNNPNRGGESYTNKTPEISTTLYTYTLEINKKDKETHENLDDVGFKLYRTSDNKFAEVSNGVITDWVDEISATEIFTKDGGKLKLIGLDADETYMLKEITPLDGYNTMDDAKFVIDSEFSEEGLTTLTISVNDGAATNGDTEVGLVSMTVENSQGKVLPSTGGIGTIIFYCVGGFLLLLAIFLIIILCKRDKDEEENEESKTNK